MTYRADPAGTRCQRRHFGEWPSFAEFLEAAKLGDMELRVLNGALVVQVNSDFGMTFDASHRIDQDFSRHGVRLQIGFCLSNQASVLPAVQSAQSESYLPRAGIRGRTHPLSQTHEPGVRSVKAPG